jgi:hypothetical protein
MLDELMNDCGDGKVLIDLYKIFEQKKTVGKVLLRLFVNALYTFPILLVWGAVSLVFNTILCFYVGGYGTGQFLNALVNGAAWPWDN